MQPPRWLLGLPVLAGVSVVLAPSLGPPTTQPGVVGNWRLVSAKANEKPLDLPSGTTILKHVTPTDFMFVYYYDRSGEITAAGGGPYTLRGTRYAEVVEYGLGAGVRPLFGKTQVFTLRIEGTRWYHGGKESDGTVIEEVWERIHRPGSP